MKKENDEGKEPVCSAAERLAEINALSRSLRQTLAEMIADIKVGGKTTASEALKKLNELQAVHLKVLAAEDAFHAKIGTDPDAEAIDHDAIRFEIGRQIDRLRQSLIAEAVSEGFDARTISDIALSLRLLGDATSDRTER